MDIQSFASTHVYTIGPNSSTANAAISMRDNNVGCLVVVDNEKICGILTDRDLTVYCHAEGHDPNKCTVSNHVISPAITAEPSADTVEVAHIMAENNIRRIPIVNEGKLVGIVSFSDIALALDILKRSMDETMHDLLMGMGGARSSG